MSWAHGLGGSHDVGITLPAKFRLNRLVGLLFQPRTPHRVGTQHSEKESAYVRPMCHGRELTIGRAIKKFCEQPEWKKPVSGHLELDRVQGDKRNHLDFELGEADKERTHECGNG